jgi:hypothetical protein
LLIEFLRGFVNLLLGVLQVVGVAYFSL